MNTYTCFMMYRIYAQSMRPNPSETTTGSINTYSNSIPINPTFIHKTRQFIYENKALEGGIRLVHLKVLVTLV